MKDQLQTQKQQVEKQKASFTDKDGIQKAINNNNKTRLKRTQEKSLQKLKQMRKTRDT